ncbi:MAG TPA: ABC transporter permease subunit [Thermotogota bacterium]|nr:ABC transporter permease subunit [Thermotogota bacterium]HPR96775.1 ABC transporter permease subunit [Thermotogota bacterium]
MKNPILKTIIYVIVFIGVAVMIMPFAWMIMTSFKLDSEVESWPPKWISSSFSNESDTNLELVRSGGIAIDFSAMTIEEFFNLDKIIKAQTATQSPLVYTIEDDPPYRGVMTISLSPDKGYVEYAENISDEQLNQLAALFSDEIVLPDEISETYSNMAMIEDPMSRINSLMNYLYYNRESPITRKELVKAFRTTGEKIAAYIDKNGEKIIDHKSLIVMEDDSEEAKNEKEAVKAYVSELIGSINTKFGKFNLYLDDFSKGEPVLTYDEIQALKGKADELFINLEAPVESADWAVLRLTEKNITVPLLQNMNLVNLGLNVYDFYNGAQNKKAEAPVIRFKFREQEEIVKDLKAALDASSYSDQTIALVKSIIDNDMINSTNRVYTELDNRFDSNFEPYHLSNEEFTVLNTELVKFAALVNGHTEDDANLNHSIKSVLLKGDSIEKALSDSTLSQDVKNQLTAEYRIVLNSLDAITNDSGTSNRILAEKIEFEEFSQYYTSLFSDIYYRMEIIEAPSFVKTVSYKNLRSIEIALDGVHPVWFWDETQTMKTEFTFGEVFKNVFQNYVNAWQLGKYFGNYYFNTVFIALITTVLDILFASMAAFAFAKLKFWGKNFIFMLFLSTMMVPGEVLLVPNYITLSVFGWIDTYFALIVPWTVSVFVIFLLRQHFMTIPDELYDAGRIDGISKWGFLWRIMIPLSKPVIITGSLLKFIGSWNSFLWVLIVTKSPEVRTLPVGLANFSSEVGTLYNQLMAASTFSMLPVVILFMFVQKYFIQGIARTGLK